MLTHYQPPDQFIKTNYTLAIYNIYLLHSIFTLSSLILILFD